MVKLKFYKKICFVALLIEMLPWRCAGSMGEG